MNWETVQAVNQRTNRGNNFANPTNEVTIKTKDKIINVVAFNSNGEPIFESQVRLYLLNKREYIS